MSKSIENVQAIKSELENPANDGVLFTDGVVFASVVEQAEDHDGKVIGVVGLSKVEEDGYSTPVAVEEIQGIVAKLKKKNIGIIISDHNVDETLAITDRAYLMVEGKLFRSGTAEELANDPMVRKVYLGQNFQLRRANVATQ